jgi:hypothetical protein
MNNDFYFKILDKAAKAGIYNSVDITTDIVDCLKRMNINGRPANWYELPYTLLDPLQAKDYIHYLKLHPEMENPESDDWMGELKIIITLHPEGLLFLYERDKILYTKKSVLYSKIAIWATAFFAFLTLYFTASNYIISNKNYAFTTGQLKPLQRELTVEQQLTKQTQLQVDSLVVLVDRLLANTSPKKR